MPFIINYNIIKVKNTLIVKCQVMVQNIDLKPKRH